MEPIKNIFMCLVHENQDCIIDLVRNLKYLDSKSTILLYNGGTDKELFNHFPFEKYGVIIHPDPKPLKWGWLHDFAIDCMEYAINNLDFDTITVVDSDQLGSGRNYTDFITQTFRENPNLGMLGQMPARIFSDTSIDPAITAYEEKELWEPFLAGLPNGKEAFLHWTFWPSTVFTYKASVALTNLFRRNEELQSILKRTKIWASEEIILPTLIVALGFVIVENTCKYDFVKYKSAYSKENINHALQEKKVFWIHPVVRDIRDKNRILIREFYENYVSSNSKESSEEIFQLIKSIQPKMANIEGWLDNDEFELLVEFTFQKAKNKKKPIFLEIGSYCGKATSVISLAAKEANDQSKIIAIDDFTGRLGAEDAIIHQYPSCYDKFNKNLEALNLLGAVDVIKQTSYLVAFEEKIDLILIDGLHDYANVARDFYHFEKNFTEDTIVFFHDYCVSFPGVMSFVNELINNDTYQIVKHSGSLIALQKKTGPHFEHDEMDSIQQSGLKSINEKIPLVSCIMPTYNRPEFISHAVQQFLEQNYPNKELIIIDDSENSIRSLVPNNYQIKYVYLNEKLDLGSKRNMACQISKGQFIIHLDDDDFYAPNWIQKQLTFLMDNDLEVTGLNKPLFYDKITSNIWQYNYPIINKPWVYGATLCYTRKIWESNPFPVMNCGEDNAFVWAQCVQKILPNNAIEAYLGQIHYKNTSPKQTNNVRWGRVAKEQADIIFANYGIESIPILSNYN